MPTSPLDVAALRQRAGQPAVTAWERFGQPAVDAYGALTGEDMWIHTDPVRAGRSRFGGTIVQSSLLLARFGGWIRQVSLWLPEPAVPLNYGYDRIRIPGALPVGARVRGRIVLDALREERAGRVRLELSVTAELDDARPVLVAQWLVVFLTGDLTGNPALEP